MASATKQTKLTPASNASDVQAVLEQVDNLLGEIDKLNEQASEDILKVEQKYNKQRQPLFQQRSELLAKIPHFWITVLINHPQIGSLIGEQDEQILQHLTKLEVQEFDDIKSGYKITLHFETNEYFKNETIVKEFRRNDAGELSAKSSAIEWTGGKNILAKSDAAQQAAAKGDRKRRHDDEQSLSLMRWFVSDQLGDEGQAYMGALEIGELIKDELWSNPLQFYLSGDDESDQEGGAELEGAEDDGALSEGEGDGEDDGDGDDFEGGEEGSDAEEGSDGEGS